MTPLRSVLVTMDFSEPAQHAAQRAALIAAQHQARLRLLHVLDPARLQRVRGWFAPATPTGAQRANAEEALARLAAELAGRHAVEVIHAVELGDPVDRVRQMSAQADLLVIGSKRSNPLRSLIFGSPTERLLRLVHGPVLVTKQPAPSPYRQVLAAVELGPHALPMLHGANALAPGAARQAFHALSLARQGKMRAHGVPASVICELSQAERQRSLLRLRSLVASAGLTDMQAEIGQGDPAAQTLMRQREIEADLLVLGRDGHGALCNFLLGSVTQRVLAGAPCDVLIVPALPPHRAFAARGALPAPATSGAGRAPFPAAKPR